MALELRRFSFWFSEEKARAILLTSRGWGPFVLILLQALQVFLAPIPGQFLGVAGGYIFGPWFGTVYSMIGTILGSILAITLARKFGRPLVERFVAKETLARVDELTVKAGIWFFFIAFLLPFFPDDALCFLAGLSSIPIPWLLAAIIIGRLPGVAASAFLGAGISRLPPEFIAVALILGLLLILAYLLLPRKSQLRYYERGNLLSVLERILRRFTPRDST
ncbi:MAG: TVP38/TMEM64 family protein [Anaerolineae bacterium]|nr:TVP38/TMEM64 family protein [Anaerolineae bacterium]